ncbi:MAG TPA: LPS assembly protein LptD [Steroidobacteraceae bacterium]
MPETSIRVAIRGLGLSLLLVLDAAHADEPPCPSSAPAATEAARAATPPDPDAPITIESDDKDFEFGVDGNARLCGNVEMKQGDRTIRADCLEYNSKTQDATLKGGIEYTDPMLTVRGNSGTYSPTLGADFQGTQFELPERGARGSAKNLKADASGKLTLEGVNFTTCPANQVDWQLNADEIELDTRARTGTGRGTKIEFKGVPIVYLPWMTFPLGDQRKSGFLFPNFGASSRNGAVVEVPYYWNIRPNLDFTAEPVYYSKRGLDLAGEIRYLTPRQRGEFEFNYLPNDSLADQTRSRLKLAHVAELPGEWRVRIDATDVSDTNYFEDFARGPEGTSVPFAERLAEVTYRDEHFNVRGQVQDFQVIDEELAAEDRPYTRAPRLLASGDWDKGLGTVDYGFDAELVDFERNTGVTGWRLDVAPRAGLDVSAPGYFIRPSIGYRYTAYSLENQDSGTDASPTRSLPYATFDTGLVFERSSGSHGQRRLTLEPRALYLYTPFRDQSQLPLFDTGLPDLNLVQLYRTNRYVGADRVNDANQVAFGLTSRLLSSESGAQYLAASVGQAFYFEKPRVVLPGEPPATRDTSDFIAQVSLTAYKNWNLEAGFQYNPEDQVNERQQYRLQYRPDGERVVNLAYRALRDRIEQVDTSIAWPIGKRWNVYGRYVYSLLDSKTLDQFAGFEYKACCYKLRAIARRSVSNRNGNSETEFLLTLELNGLAGVGTADDAFLEHAIRGYSRETLLPGKTTP